MCEALLVLWSGDVDLYAQVQSVFKLQLGKGLWHLHMHLTPPIE
jgi:hypothetical protein